jgi:Zn-finger nucleic acid-binding protein
MEPTPPTPPTPPASCPRCRKVPLDNQPLVRHCGRCKGSWIAEQALNERITHAQGERPHHGLTWHEEARAALMCAICAQPMQTLVVADTPVDRCPRHGIWFDAKELAHVLAMVAGVAAPVAVAAAPHEPVASDLVGDGVELAADLAIEAAAGPAVDGAGYVAASAAEVVTSSVFEVAGSAVGAAAETGAEVAVEVAAEAGGGIFEVVIGGVGFVAEAVVDAIAGIFS